jgi:hypothetical protein
MNTAPKLIASYTSADGNTVADVYSDRVVEVETVSGIFTHDCPSIEDAHRYAKETAGVK